MAQSVIIISNPQIWYDNYVIVNNWYNVVKATHGTIYQGIICSLCNKNLWPPMITLVWGCSWSDKDCPKTKSVRWTLKIVPRHTSDWLIEILRMKKISTFWIWLTYLFTRIILDITWCTFYKHFKECSTLCILLQHCPQSWNGLEHFANDDKSDSIIPFPYTPGLYHKKAPFSRVWSV